MIVGQLFLGAMLLFLAGMGVRVVAQDVERRLPAQQRQKVAQARTAAGAKLSPVTSRVKQARARYPRIPPWRTTLSRIPRPRLVRWGPQGKPAAPVTLPPGVTPISGHRPKPSPHPSPHPSPSPAPVLAPVPTEVPPMSTGTATPGSAGADLFTATQHIVSHAEAGGIRSKLRAVKTFAEGLDYEASSLERWAQRLAEPDQAYPPVVWEPISRAAAHMRAAQQLLGESDSALTSIIGATVGEAAGSGIRVPHHNEINTGN